MDKLYKFIFLTALFAPIYSMQDRVPSLQQLAANKIFQLDSGFKLESFLESKILSCYQLESLNWGNPRNSMINNILLGKYYSQLWKFLKNKINRYSVEYNHDNSITAIKFSEDSNTIFWGDCQGNVYSLKIKNSDEKNKLFDLVEETKFLGTHGSPITFIKCIDKKSILTSSQNGYINLWKHSTYSKSFFLFPEIINSFDFIKKEDKLEELLIGFNKKNSGISCQSALYNTGNLSYVSFKACNSAKLVFFDNENNNFWICYSNGKIFNCDHAGDELGEFSLGGFFKIAPTICHYSYKNNKIYILADSLQGKYLYSFDLKTKEFKKMLSVSVFYEEINSIEVSPDEKCIMITFFNYGTEMYLLSSGEKVFSIDHFFCNINSVAFSPDGTKFACSVGQDLFIYPMPLYFINTIQFFTDLVSLMGELKKSGNNSWCQII